MRGPVALKKLALRTFKETAMKTSLPLAILAVATALAAAPSPAAPVVSLVDWNDARSLTVEHKDLNLATPSGIGMLHRRIDAAVAQVCALPNAKQIAQRTREADCRTVARRQGMEQASRVIGAA